MGGANFFDAILINANLSNVEEREEANFAGANLTGAT
jgi:uncharacterized protein YjbI with pentapeptide repeats